MKIKAVLLSCLVSLVVLFAAHQYSLAQANYGKPALLIATISVSRAIQDCRATAKFGEKARTENAGMEAEEYKLDKEVQAMTAALRVGTLKPDSTDYAQQCRELVQKQTQLKVMQDTNARLKILAQQLWTEKLYKEILRITKELVSQEGLALVLAVDEPEFPMPRYEELVMALRTHKVLCSDGCLDLTDKVIAVLDKEEAKLNP